MLNSKKGDFGTTIIIAVIAVAIVFGSVLYFFFVFKAHATLQARDEYIWNKVQEVPMDLLSMDIDGESFVSKMNKVYYEFESEDELDEVKDNVNKQLFYFLGDVPPNMGYILSIGDITVSESPYPDCKCKLTVEGFSTTCKCQGGCGSKENEYCVKSYVYVNGMYVPLPDLSKCFDIGEIKYHGTYPFPLTFNGTAKLIDRLFYDAVEYK